MSTLFKSSFLGLAALVLMASGCDSACDSTAETKTELQNTRAQLSYALSHSNDRQEIVNTCDGLIESAENLRVKADEVRNKIAASKYSIPAGSCLNWESRYRCHGGGWTRVRYYLSSATGMDFILGLNSAMADEGVLDTEAQDEQAASVEVQGFVSRGSRGGSVRSGGSRYTPTPTTTHRGGGDRNRPAPSRPAPRPEPRPVPRPVPGRDGGYRPAPAPAPTPDRGGRHGGYRPPRYRPVPVPVPAPRPAYPIGRGPRPVRPARPVYSYPTRWPHYWNRGWDWYYVEPVCSYRQYCTSYAPGSIKLPGYDDAMAVAYQLDQIAGNLETACRSAYEYGDLQEAISRMQAAYDEINQRTLPEANNLYVGMGCTSSGN